MEKTQTNEGPTYEFFVVCECSHGGAAKVPVGRHPLEGPELGEALNRAFMVAGAAALDIEERRPSDTPEPEGGADE